MMIQCIGYRAQASFSSRLELARERDAHGSEKAQAQQERSTRKTTFRALLMLFR